jgi:perosamine synthetase
MKIPLSAPDITEAEIEVVTSVLRTSRLSLGPKLEEFENALAKYVGVSEAVAVSSGTAALHLCLRALEISEGDEVILPSFAFIAVANAVRYVGAIPVFVDIDPVTLNLDHCGIEAAISPCTRAILVVHTFGCPAAMKEIVEIARSHKLYVIEDACEALGAEYQGRKAGFFGDVGVFGFYPNKQITTGEGGAIVTKNPKVASHIRMLRNQGRGKTNDWFQHNEVGYNYRISELNCALGVAQLQRIGEILRTREDIAHEYEKRLKNNPLLTAPPLQVQNGKISWFVYAIHLAEKFSETQCDSLLQEMSVRGIECGRYFAPIHLQPAYASEPHRCMDLRVTESIAPRTLSLPFFNRITSAQIEAVCQILCEVLKKLNS